MAAAVAAAWLSAAAPATARVLMVGAGQPYATPGAAARAAAAGDEVRILPGTYYDCAVWDADRLVIAGAGPDQTVLTDTACQGKASFVIGGRGVTVRDLTLARIRVPDGNGAGIRAEGADLTVERVRFENDQQGLLALPQPGGTLRVIDCSFIDDGVTETDRAAAALQVGGMARLVVRNTEFAHEKAGIAIASAAAMTEISGSRIAAAARPLGATVQVSGGLTLDGTTLQAGPVRGDRRAAVLALPAADGDAPLALRHDTLAGGGILLLNWSGRSAVLEANDPGPHGVVESTGGAWTYRLRHAAREGYDALKQTARHLARRALDLLRNR